LTQYAQQYQKIGIFPGRIRYPATLIQKTFTKVVSPKATMRSGMSAAKRTTCASAAKTVRHRVSMYFNGAFGLSPTAQYMINMKIDVQPRRNGCAVVVVAIVYAREL